ncbi:MAG: hypothetical protein Q4F34_01170 [Prevotellaceae bacterium]|nr:hypothetical protein [Prevotellaceae bacterium]
MNQEFGTKSDRILRGIITVIILLAITLPVSSQGVRVWQNGGYRDFGASTSDSITFSNTPTQSVSVWQDGISKDYSAYSVDSMTFFSEQAIPDIEYEYTDIDLENYIYPSADAKINPNLAEFNIDKDEVVSFDSINNIAVLRFAGSVPKLYRGSIVPLIYNDIARALFVLEVQVDGKTATIHYRKAQITEIFFNQTIHISSEEEAMTRSTTRDYDGKFLSRLKLLNMLGGGLNITIDDCSINFDDTKFDLTFGNFLLFYGKSLNCPFRRLTAVLGGDVVAKGSFEMEPSFQATKGWCKDLKQSVVRIRKIIFIYGIPVDIDFNIDVCADLNIQSKISRAFYYARDVGATLKVNVGAEYDFETGKLIPLNKLEFTPVDANSEMRNLPENLHMTFDASIFPRFKIYFYEFKWAGWGCDFKPIFEKLQFDSMKKDGHLFFSSTFSLGSSLKGFMYVWDWDKNCNKYLAESPTFEKIWFAHKSPNDIEEDVDAICERLNFGGQSKTSFTVTDLVCEWNQKSIVPPAAEEMSIEVERFGTLPDPNINPEYYDEKMGGGDFNGKTHAAAENAWYSQGIDYFRLNKEGKADVPFKVDTPAGEDFKLVARILDGNGDVIKEVEHPTQSGFKHYKCVQTLVAAGKSVKFELEVKDYGAWVHEVCPNFPDDNITRNDVIFDHGNISGYMIIDGISYPSSTFFGCGDYQCQTVPAPLRPGEGRKSTMSEALDFSRWAADKLGLSTEGARYYNTEWNGYPATVCAMPDGGGTWTYVGNFMAKIEGGEVTITTDSFRIIEDEEE